VTSRVPLHIKLLYDSRMTGLQHLRYDSVKPESSQIGSPNTTNGLVILLLIKHSDFFKLQILQTKNLERGCT